MQAFTFYASEDKLVNRGNQAGVKIGVESINREACRIAKEVAAEGDALVLGGISQCPSYLSGKPKQAVQAEFAKQIKVFVEEGLDFLLCEVNITNNHSSSRIKSSPLVSVFRAYRGDGVGHRGVRQDQSARGRQHVHRARGGHARGVRSGVRHQDGQGRGRYR